MGASPFRSGDELVSESLPAGYFNELSGLLWKTGVLACGSVLQNPLAPSIFKAYSILTDRYCLEMEFGFRPNARSGATEVVSSMGTVSEMEPAQHFDNATAYYWRSFSLDLRHKRKEFSKGASIVSELGELLLTQDSPIGGRTRGPRAWREMAQLDTTCTRDDYDAFMTGLQAVHAYLREKQP